MEKIYDVDPKDILTDDYIFATIIEYVDVATLFTKVGRLSKDIKQAVESENYCIFLKLRDYLNIPSSYNCSDLAAKTDIVEAFKQIIAIKRQKSKVISAFAYYTDGGVDTNSNYYFLQNVWKKTNIGYCTVSHENVHVQSILSKTVDLPSADNNPMNFLMEPPNNKLKIRIPYEDYLSSTTDQFHLLRSFQIYLKSGGYNAYVRSFAVFYSEGEVDRSKFNLMTKRFLKVKSSADLQLLKLKVKHKVDDK